MKRLDTNPVVRREDVRPSHPDFRVFGVFNCGAVKVAREYLLLMRVAERPPQERGWLSIPMLNAACDAVEVQRIRADAPGVDARDNRVVKLANGHVLLTSISHLRLARSRDGRKFTVDAAPTMFPAVPYERYGMEDPRITRLGGRWWINYSAISEAGVVTALASTSDWKEFRRDGIMFAPTDKDVCVFPRKIGGRYVCRHRPWAEGLGVPAVWTAYSKDLIHWGEHRFTMGPRAGHWDDERVGCGPPPIRTDKGWLEIYHGADRKGCYRLGAMLSDLRDPARVIARSRKAILQPEAEYETHGIYAPCVFCNGMIAERDGMLRVYYGAADTVVACAETSVDELLQVLSAER